MPTHAGKPSSRLAAMPVENGGTNSSTRWLPQSDTARWPLPVTGPAAGGGRGAVLVAGFAVIVTEAVTVL